ncbi:unnamed protein product [Bemisia tabaci]|uniref:CRAL-TRIO domain-containing protein n=2 Tax=Bemisia tabaci TaxID=7038 RepID=A0A9P0AP11_BEMTA|nr:unnamed protein product [Bemisia tabaci]
MTTIEPPPAEQIKKDIAQIKEWLTATPHLPSVEDEDWLETIHRNCKFRLEKTKSKLDAYFSLKGKHPAILRDRDPLAPALVTARSAVTLAVAEQVTNDGSLLVYHIHQPDHSILNAADYYKRIVMLHDVILLERLAPNGVLFIVDFTHFRYQHFLKIMMHVRALVEILVSCYAEKIKAAYLITESELVVQMIKLITKLSPQKMRERVKLHGTSMSKMPREVDEEVLSNDLGGKGPSLAHFRREDTAVIRKVSRLVSGAGPDLRKFGKEKQEGAEGVI